MGSTRSCRERDRGSKATHSGARDVYKVSRLIRTVLLWLELVGVAFVCVAPDGGQRCQEISLCSGSVQAPF